ncbi:MAG: GNAT family N-acetyltransferase [Coriobacteriia bacterium]
MPHAVTPVFADSALAQRLERIAAKDLARFGRIADSLYPESGAEALRIGGGAALWMGEDSPLNVACGLGMGMEVTVDDLDVLEAFYAAHDSPCSIAICPLADHSLGTALTGRGYSITGFENVLVLPLAEFDTVPVDARVAEVRGDSLRSWERTVACGFSGSSVITPADERVAQVIANDERARYFMAWIDDVPVGTGELVITDGVGWLSADSTLPEYRGRGVQSAIQIARLAAASAAGCELAVTESLPGSASMRNMERRGFRVAYTRVEVAR